MNATRKGTPRGLRTLGWVAVASMLSVALLAPGGAAAIEGGNPPSVECAGYLYYFKIDSGALVATTYGDGAGAEESDVVTNWPGQTITISNITDGGQQFDWSSALPVGDVVTKEGNDEFNAGPFDPPVSSGHVDNEIQQGLSHITFCGDPATTTTTSTETTETTTTETTETTETTTTESTTTSTSTSFSQSVGGETDPPVITNPPSDAIGGDRAMGTGGTWRLLLIGLAGLLASLLVLTPAKASRRR